MISFMEKVMFTKISIFKILRFQLRFLASGLQTLQCLFKERQACGVFAQGYQSVELYVPRVHLCGLLFPGSIVESDFHTKTR